MELTIRTNNVPRDIIYGFELSENEKKDFDFLNAEEIDQSSFFRYKGIVYYLGNFMVVPKTDSEMSKWDGYESDSFFSGTVVRFVDDCERVIVGRYYS